MLLQVVCTGPLTCVAHFELHKKCDFFFFDVECLSGEGRGSMIQEIGGLHGISERGG